jgi:hypothetical protein
MQSQTLECAVKPAKTARNIAPRSVAKSVAELIEAHRKALAAHIAACDRLEVAETAAAVRGDSLRLVDDLLGTHYEIDLVSRDQIEAGVRRRCADARSRANDLAKFAPEFLEATLGAIDAREAKSLDHIAAAFAEFDASEVGQAEKSCGELAHAAAEALRELCACPCSTLEEGREKAAYLIELDEVEDQSDECLRLLLQSFLATHS